MLVQEEICQNVQMHSYIQFQPVKTHFSFWMAGHDQSIFIDKRQPQFSASFEITHTMDIKYPAVLNLTTNNIYLNTRQKENK